MGGRVLGGGMRAVKHNLAQCKAGTAACRATMTPRRGRRWLSGSTTGRIAVDARKKFSSRAENRQPTRVETRFPQSSRSGEDRHVADPGAGQVGGGGPVGWLSDVTDN